MAVQKFTDTVQIPVGEVQLTGVLMIPEDPQGLVIFAHGSGSNHLSPRNQEVASHLQQEGFATVLFDMLTPEEQNTYRSGLDLELFSGRLMRVMEWAREQEEVRHLPIGYFGASTGAALALRAAAERPEDVKAVVSRGGRPDLVAPDLSRVLAPTLLIIGSLDEPVITYNNEAFGQLLAIKDLRQIEGAGHLFEEEGTLEQVAELTADWFKRYLRKDKLHPLRQDQP